MCGFDLPSRCVEAQKRLDNTGLDQTARTLKFCEKIENI